MTTFRWNRIRSQLSAWFLAVFFILIISGAVISELFQSSPLPSNLSQLYVNPIQENFTLQVSSIDFKNKFGKFTLQKIVDESSPLFRSWNLTVPRELPAKSLALESIFKTLLSIKIKKLHQFEPINIASFSLDNPLISMTLYAPEKNIDVNFGLINPIDNSAYMTVSGHKTIYQVESLEFPLETFELTSFIESKIFLTPLDEITGIAIYRGNNKSPSLEFNKTEDTWTDENKRELDKEKVQDYLKKLTMSKSQLILDKSDEKLKEKLEKEMKYLSYRVEVYRGDKKSTYEISQPIKAMAEYKIEHRKSLIITSSAEDYPYIAKRELLTLLDARSKSFRAPSIKKIFY